MLLGFQPNSFIVGGNVSYCAGLLLRINRINLDKLVGAAAAIQQINCRFARFLGAVHVNVLLAVDNHGCVSVIRRVKASAVKRNGIPVSRGISTLQTVRYAQNRSQLTVRIVKRDVIFINRHGNIIKVSVQINSGRLFVDINEIYSLAVQRSAGRTVKSKVLVYGKRNAADAYISSAANKIVNAEINRVAGYRSQL